MDIVKSRVNSTDLLEQVPALLLAQTRLIMPLFTTATVQLLVSLWTRQKLAIHRTDAELGLPLMQT